MTEKTELETLIPSIKKLAEMKIIFGSGESELVSNIIDSYSITNKSIHIEFSPLVQRALDDGHKLEDLTDFIAEK